MNIDKAIEHFHWKFKNTWKPTQKDVEAFNSIIDYKELVESKTLSENELLAKLWIEKLLLLNRSNLYSAERSIQVIDEILSKSLYECCIVLKNELPFMRFNALLYKYGTDYSNKNLDVLNRSKINDINKDILDNHEKELKEVLMVEISEEKTIEFVKKQITRILHKFEK